ncbi:MAG: type II toxin-antitoxin system ParD family antitoxin [Alphaproteobacteria bacterium]|nr:type II toxin-antitoxin system ParD family antitoxin [Alphaproteobacteria bacterium]
MDTKTIELPRQLSQWVEERVESGEFADTSDYMRELIRRDQEQREWLVSELIKGEESGTNSLTVDDIWAEAVAEYRARKMRKSRAA